MIKRNEVRHFSGYCDGRQIARIQVMREWSVEDAEACDVEHNLEQGRRFADHTMGQLELATGT